jgi:hypothetical protein
MKRCLSLSSMQRLRLRHSHRLLLLLLLLLLQSLLLGRCLLVVGCDPHCPG